MLALTNGLISLLVGNCFFVFWCLVEPLQERDLECIIFSINPSLFDLTFYPCSWSLWSPNIGDHLLLYDFSGRTGPDQSTSWHGVTQRVGGKARK